MSRQLPDLSGLRLELHPDRIGIMLRDNDEILAMLWQRSLDLVGRPELFFYRWTYVSRRLHYKLNRQSRIREVDEPKAG
jgi:hypothetical protein